VKGPAERKSAWILGGIAAVEGVWVLLNFVHNPGGFLRYTGFAPGQGGTIVGWLLSALVTGLFVWQSMRLPSVRENLLRLSFLKVLGLAVAISAGFLEEIVFRKWLMDYLRDQDIGVALQVLASAATFGLAHGIWGLMGRSMRAAIGATIATGVLGASLALVYLAADRSLAPCIAAHFLINALIEPGLVLAAIRGEMARDGRGR
jgi:uncharacterized protein